MYRLHCQKNPYHSGFLARKAHARKKPESHTDVLISGAHARLLSIFDRNTCSAHYVAGRSRVIPLKVTCHVTKNPNNTGEIGASVYIGKKNSEISAEFQKITLRRWVFRFRFFGVFRGSCLATFNEKPEMRERFGFFDCQCKRHYSHSHDYCDQTRHQVSDNVHFVMYYLIH